MSENKDAAENKRGNLARWGTEEPGDKHRSWPGGHRLPEHRSWRSFECIFRTPSRWQGRIKREHWGTDGEDVTGSGRSCKTERAVIWRERHSSVISANERGGGSIDDGKGKTLEEGSIFDRVDAGEETGS